MSKKLEGKVAVITGGNSGIGLATARQFVAEGAHVFITGRRRAELDQAVTQVGKHVSGVPGDVADLADLDRLFATVKRQQGRLDVLFANAGVAKLSPLASTSELLFDEMMDTNFRGAYFTVQKALPLLPDGGSVVFTTSYFGQVGMAGTSAVSASKAALRSLTRTLASELLPRNIRVNAISPGVIATPLSSES